MTVNLVPGINRLQLTITEFPILEPGFYKDKVYLGIPIKYQDELPWNKISFAYGTYENESKTIQLWFKMKFENQGVVDITVNGRIEPTKDAIPMKTIEFFCLDPSVVL